MSGSPPGYLEGEGNFLLFLISGHGAASVFAGSHPVLAEPSAIPKQGVHKQPGFWDLRQSV